jgi:hypothetical protein
VVDGFVQSEAVHLKRQATAPPRIINRRIAKAFSYLSFSVLAFPFSSFPFFLNIVRSTYTLPSMCWFEKVVERFENSPTP